MTESFKFTSFIGDELNYFGHELILNKQLSETYSGSHMYECKICNIIANCYNENNQNYYYYRVVGWHKIELTCEEIIIKRLLE